MRTNLAQFSLAIASFCLFFTSVVKADMADMPSHLVANQWVRHEPGKPLAGSVVIPQANGVSKKIEVASVALVGEDGAVRRVETNDQGTFAFDNVSPGIYALTARAKGVFSIVALHVVDAAAEDASQYPTEVEMSAALIDYATVNSAMVRYLPPSGSPVPAMALNDVKLSDLAEKVLGADMFRVAQSGKGMKGRIYTAGVQGATLPAAAGSNIFITKNGEEVARTITNADGTFAIENLAIGQYSLLTVGPGGLGLVGFELVDPVLASKASAALSRNPNEVFASSIEPSVGFVPSFEFQIAPIPEVVESVEVLAQAPGTVISDVVLSEEVIGEEVLDDGFGAPIPGGGFAPGGGGSFGGGGGGGAMGGGGGGGLLGIAAIGGIAAAAIGASDSNDDNFVLPPASSPGN